MDGSYKKWVRSTTRTTNIKMLCGIERSRAKVCLDFVRNILSSLISRWQASPHPGKFSLHNIYWKINYGLPRTTSKQIEISFKTRRTELRCRKVRSIRYTVLISTRLEWTYSERLSVDSTIVVRATTNQSEPRSKDSVAQATCLSMLS